MYITLSVFLSCVFPLTLVLVYVLLGNLLNKKRKKNRLKVRAMGNDGAYLVYQPIKTGPYMLLVYHKKDTVCRKIQLSQSAGGKYILGEYGPAVTGYATVKELIKAHRGVSGRPIRIQGGGSVTLSKSFVHRPSN